MLPLVIVGSVIAVVILLVVIVALLPHGDAGGQAGGTQPNNAVANNGNGGANNGGANNGGANNGGANNGGNANGGAPANGAPVGDGSETRPIRAANPSAVTVYETEVTDQGPPDALDGATLINTQTVVQAMTNRDQGKASFWMIDARGCGDQSIPTAICLEDNTINGLRTLIPDHATTLVIFCLDGSCPESYHFASAAIQDGYTHVYWYRGGANAWAAAGLPTVSGPQGR
jgi:rhodanese-related sulfurtransferase